MGNPVIHFEIAVKDSDKGIEFYSKLFDWKIIRDEASGYNLISTGVKDSITGAILESIEGEFDPYATVYVQVDDVKESLQKALELGGAQELGVTDLEGTGRIAMFRDPDGVIIGLFEPVKS